DKASDVAGGHIERHSKFLVAETLAAQEQNFGVTAIQSGENRAYLCLPGLDGVQVFGRRRCFAKDTEEPLEPVAARLTAQFVQGFADRSSIQPAFRSRLMNLRVSPPFQKDFDGKFFRAGL